MGLASLAIDHEKIQETIIDGCRFQYVYIDDSDYRIWSEGRLARFVDDPEDTPEDEAEKLRELLRRSERLSALYVAEEVVKGWDDEDIPYSHETAVKLLTSREYAHIAKTLFVRASKAINFRLSEDEAVKKFAPDLSDDKSDGDETTLKTATG